ncbi:MAG: OB-fold nucleic acid binding domain-containing protein [Paludibacteraceae bacterium]|nr:OB-fold nucleic acid binding domain-containing protein [Paludibacteraceae bacterium]
MRLNKIYSALMLTAAMFFAACNNQNIPEEPDPNQTNPNQPGAVVDTVAIPDGIEIPEGAITVSKARAICEKLENNVATEEFYFVHGWIKKLHSANTTAIEGDYHNAQFYISENKMVDEKGNETYDSDDLYAYRVKGPDNSSITDVNAVQVGDYVVLKCKLTNYNNTFETPMNSGSYIYASTNPLLVGAEPVTDYTDITVAQAIEKAQAGDQGNYRVTATVVEVKTAKDKVPGTYTNINMTVKDETGKIDCFYTNYIDNKPFTSADQIPPVGTKLTVIGKVKMYTKDETSTPEFYEAYIGEIIEIGTGGGEIIADATAITIAEAIEKAKAGDKGNYKLTGIVYSYSTDLTNVPGTYTNVDFTLKDETGSITCFRTNYIDNMPFSAADQIPPVGSKISVVGPLTMYQETTPEVDHGYITEVIERGNGTVPLNPDDFTGDGSKENPYTIADVIALDNALEGPFWVKGYIVGSANGSISKPVFESGDNAIVSNILIADDAAEDDAAEKETKKLIPVELKNSTKFRTEINLKDNPNNLGQEILIHGKLVKYFSVAGVKELDDAYINNKHVGEEDGNEEPIIIN